MALAGHRITQGNNQCCNKEMVGCPGVEDTSVPFSHPQLKCEQGIKRSLSVFYIWRTETECSVACVHFPFIAWCISNHITPHKHIISSLLSLLPSDKHDSLKKQ